MYYGAACAHCQRVAQENRSPRLAAAHFAVFVAVFIAAEILFRFVGFSLPSGCAPRGRAGKVRGEKGEGGGGSTHDYIVKVLYVIIAAVGGCATCAPSLSLSLSVSVSTSLSLPTLSLFFSLRVLS